MLKWNLFYKGKKISNFVLFYTMKQINKERKVWNITAEINRLKENLKSGYFSQNSEA